MRITNVKFIKSVANSFDVLTDKNEYAFVGRSNVGKSSLLNFLVNSKIAKTSSTPGRTQLINYFEINKQFYFVDLPGYGFAKLNKEKKQSWGKLLGDYLINSPKLKCVFMLVDIRHKPNDLDKQMQKFLYFYQIPTVIIATKCDKLSRAQMHNQKQLIANELGVGKANIILTSSSSKLGLQEVLDKIEFFENLPVEESENNEE